MTVKNDLSLAIAKQISEMSRKSSQKTKSLISQLFDNHKGDPSFIRDVGVHLYHNVDYTLAGFIFDAITKLYPSYPAAYNSLAMVLGRFGQASLAAKAYQSALALNGSYEAARKNLAFVLHYFGETGRPEILEAQVNVAKSAYPKPQAYLSVDDILKEPNRKLRVGYVSGDLHEHPVGQFMRGILLNHDASAFEILVFDSSSGDRPSENREIFEKHVPDWFRVKDKSNSELSELIASQRVDILVDLAGHTGTGRADVFVNRVAPIQVTYLGYPDTTGIENMDYRIGDTYADLEHFAEQNTETMFRLPHAMWIYTPWSTMPNETVGGSFEDTGVVTFGSANNHAKLQPEWLDVWAKVIARVPNSQLFLKSRVMNNKDVVDGVCQIFAKHGVKRDRLFFAHYSKTKEDHWLQIQKIDIALDAFPFNGATTTCDFLWLGVPVVTRAGGSHVSRTSASMLNTLGMNDWIANSDDEFVDIAVAKAENKVALRQAQNTLNDRFRASTLYDAKAFMASYESALREMWLRYLGESK